MLRRLTRAEGHVGLLSVGRVQSPDVGISLNGHGNFRYLDPGVFLVELAALARAR